MESKHGMSQYRLNSAKSCARSFLETVTKIELMYQLSLQKLVDPEIAESYIANENRRVKDGEFIWSL
ncbi:hypothetical protein P8907_20635 [Bacillus atrophaeus]|uniref:hypothetical protein n=1 Tax=Bacillus atrophaeus TaxID=1452 RepID=UPI0022818CE5|nr:hypothetical protein [Bacillus atrophaeus]MCY8810630.1 hypothetical protein [Bacillus atrophaeus]MCY8907782.1 hypothetical protein [Bacillus atrophaeus]MEC0837788.1 hypothetical protein [Bacillus atrophaeus]MEC0847689.1 hypothetical protein [Bacillus atrophaeus]MEC0849909.1 hypothetical protein [Bacillus atrophaeus]